MTIFLSNDDGYDAPGILALKSALGKKHRILLCAPLRQMSATSHSIHIGQEMELKRIDPSTFALDGSPADCVKAGLLHLFEREKIDLIISGINDGPNMGDDVFYSGTVAAAREGVMCGYPSMALSLNDWSGERHFAPAAELFSSLLDTVIDRIGLDLLRYHRVFLNINFPNRPDYRGIRVTRLGKRVYEDSVHLSAHDSREFLTLSGDVFGFEPREGSDLNAMEKDFVSVTPVAIEASEHQMHRLLLPLETDVTPERCEDVL